MTSRDSDSDFSGSIAAVYEDVFVPILFDPYAPITAGRLAHVRTGEVLEVAAGTGAVTRVLASTLPRSVAITATDLNRAMVDEAMAVGTDRSVRWAQADVMALPYEDESYDAVVCQFGVMFFEPKHDAFAEIHRVLLPDGEFVFSVWNGLDDNHFARVVIDAVNDGYDGEPSRFFERTPHGYHDESTIVDDLRAAGFTIDPSIERVDLTSRAPSAHEVAIAFCTGTPLRTELERRGPGHLTQAVAAAEAAIGERFGRADPSAEMSALLIVARKP